MKDLLNKEDYSFVFPMDKEFIVAFDDEMTSLEYTCNKTISDGICWAGK